MLKNSILLAILGGAALQRCDNYIVLNAALAAEGAALAQKRLFPQPASKYPQRMVQQREIYQWGWGSFEVRLGRRAHPGPGTQVDSIVADGQLEVCDGAYRIFVMKEKSKVPPFASR